MPKSKQRKLDQTVPSQRHCGACDETITSCSPKPSRGKYSFHSREQRRKFKRKGKKMSSTWSSSLSTKDSTGDSESKKTKAAAVKRKAQCDMCKLSYSTEKELMEHLLSLMHHTKMEDKEDNPIHTCTLCVVTCSDMADYRRHIALDSHQKKLSNLRGSDNEDSGKMDKRDAAHPGNRPPISYRVPKDYFGTGNIRDSRFKKFAPRIPQQERNSNIQSSRFGPENFPYHWKRSGSSGTRWLHEDERDFGDNSKRTIDRQSEQSNKAWCPPAHGTHFVYENNRRAPPKPWHQMPQNERREKNYNDKHRYNEYQRSEHAQDSQYMDFTSDYPYNNRRDHYNDNQGHHEYQRPEQAQDSLYMDFTSDDPCNYWDDHSLSQREHFLADMDASYPFCQPQARGLSGHKQNGHHRPDDFSARDRKRPRHEDDVQESTAKSSRSVDHSSDENVPVKDVSDRFTKPKAPLVTQKQKDKSTSKSHTQFQTASLDDASNNILERAERLCRELREKREASQAQRNQLRKKQEQEFLNQKMHTLLQKQQSYLKGHIKDSDRANGEDNYDSGISSTSTQQSKGIGVSPVTSASSKASQGSIKPASQQMSSGKSLDEIRKSIERSVLEDLDISHAKNKAQFASRTKQRTYSGGDIGGPVSKVSPRPQLSKDSLKKIVNAPKSRDERLHLAKMLHSREEQKSGGSSSIPRAHVQLEGLYDSEDVNGEISTSVGAQTIKLEDLSDNVRQQILDLIGGDIVGHTENGSEVEIQRQDHSISQKNGAPILQIDMTVLSDSDDAKNKTKSKSLSRNPNIKASNAGNSTADSSKVKKKKKFMTGCASKGTAKDYSNTVLNTNTKESRFKQNTQPITPAKQVHKPEDNSLPISLSESDVEVVSCSSDTDIKHNKDKDTEQEDTERETSRLYTRTNQAFKPAWSTSLSDDKPHEIPIDPDQTQLTSANIQEKFPILMNFPRTDSDKGSLTEGMNQRMSPDTCVTAEPSSRQSYDTATSSFKSLSPAVTQPVVLSSSSQASSNRIAPSTSALSEKGIPSSYARKEQLSSVEALPSSRLTLPPSSWLTSQPSNHTDLESCQAPVSTRSASLGGKSTLSPSTSSLLSNRTTVPHCAADEIPASNTCASASTLPVPSSTTNPSFADRAFSPDGSEGHEVTLGDKLVNSAATSHISVLPGALAGLSTTLPASNHIQRVQATDKSLNSPTTNTPSAVNMSLTVMSDSKNSRDNHSVEREPTFAFRDSHHFVNDNSSVESRGLNDDTSSQAMSELLMLSEREEEVKQEMMNMELRLTRLHRLLEQAVVQINKCTEKRNQLHEEEQDLSKRRLSLLRDAASFRQSRSDSSDMHNVSFLSDMPTRDVLLSDRTSQTQNSFQTSVTAAIVSNLPSTSNSKAASTSCATLKDGSSRVSSTERVEDVPGTSLSKADWLAKFSSYLPPDPVLQSSGRSGARTNTSTTISAPQGSNSNISSVCTISSLSLSNSLPSNRFVPVKDSPATQTVEDVEMKTHEEEFSLKISQEASQQSQAKSTGMDRSIRATDRQPLTSLNHTVGAGMSSTSTSVTVPGATVNAIAVPVMYVGSFRNQSAPMGLTTPTLTVKDASVKTVENTSTAVSHHHQNFYSRTNSVASSVGTGSGGDVQDSAFADLMSLREPSRSRGMNSVFSHGSEESDIGSIASSVASGSSLGEQITRYCRSTPGASLEIREPSGVHELSVIMSDTSERRGFDSELEDEDDNKASFSYVKKEDWRNIVRPCSVPLERLDIHSKHGIYGKLDKAAVKSAEALHLIERNEETSPLASDSSKKKKRKTRQERETSGLTRRRRHWVLSSSSDDADMNDQSKSEVDLNLSIVTSREKRTDAPSSQNDDSSDLNPMEKKKTVADDCIVVEEVMSSPHKTSGGSDITIAECDSSTGLGMVDSESIIHQAKTLREMHDSFVRTFWRAPKFSSMSQAQENFQDMNNSTTVDSARTFSDKSKAVDISAQPRQLVQRRHSLPLTDSSRLSSSGDRTADHRSHDFEDQTEGTGINIKNQSESKHMKPDAEANSLSEDIQILGISFTASTQTAKPDFYTPKQSLPNFSKRPNTDVVNCRFPCTFGPVVDISVEDTQLYIAHSNYGVCVHDMNGSSQNSLITKYPFPLLHCMRVARLDGVLTVIIGNGTDLVFLNLEEGRQTSFDLGAAVKCLLVMGSSVYAGLDTGEIALFDMKKMELREKAICSDHPIHCLAKAQEGATRLLCASAQNGTIVVLDAHNCLPIRMLLGHTKTAFSIQADGSYLYSGSGDGTVIVHNLHTASIEHIYKDSKGLVKSVFYHRGFLFAGGMDKLVRCYNTETHKLVQVLFGPEKGVITKVLIHKNMVITGNISGSVDVVDLALGAVHKCSKKGCNYNFGNKSHLHWHLLEDHNVDGTAHQSAS